MTGQLTPGIDKRLGKLLTGHFSYVSLQIKIHAYVFFQAFLRLCQDRWNYFNFGRVIRCAICPQEIMKPWVRARHILGAKHRTPIGL